MANPKLQAQSAAVARNSGIFTTPADHRELSGFDKAGNSVYMTSALRGSTDISLGQKFIQTMKGVIDPTGAFDEGSDADSFEKIGVLSNNVQTILGLDQAIQGGDTKGFVSQIANLFNTTIQKQFDDPQNQAGVGTAFSAYNLASYWKQMSPAQKSLGLASLGMNAYKFGTGENLADKVLAGGTNGHPELTLGDTLGYIQTGVNGYDLVHNWDQYSTVQKVIRGGKTAVDVATTAQKWFLNPETAAEGSKMLSSQVASQATKQGTEDLGAQAVATQGADAAAADSISLASVGSALTVAGGAYMTYDGLKNLKAGWGKGGREKGAVRGLIAGAQISGGLAMMGVALGPIGIAGIMATSVAGNMIQVGKSLDQGARDQVRGVFKSSGLTDKDYKITLASGKQVDVGIDGHGGQREVFDRDLLTDKDKGLKKLNAWDTDYTNDLDFLAGMGGITLSRLSTGGKGKNIDQYGSQLGNAAIADSNGRELNQENFTKMAANLRTFYNKQGIATAKDGENLARAAMQEGRINQIDYTQMQQTFNVVFNNDFKTAKELMLGRWKGIDVAQQQTGEAEKITPKGAAPIQFQDLVAKNQLKYANAGAA